jgi:hypothetical protein
MYIATELKLSAVGDALTKDCMCLSDSDCRTFIP